MGPKCDCWRINKQGIQDPTYIYRCRKDGKTIQYPPFTAASDTAADIWICQLYGDPNEKYEEVKGGVGGGCLPWETPVKLANGRVKPIGEIDTGDEVLACALGETELVARRVVGMAYERDAELVELTTTTDDSFVTSLDQSILTNSGPVRAQYIFMEAPIFGLDVDAKRIVRDHSRISGRTRLRDRGDVVSLDLDGDYGFFAASRLSWLWFTCHHGGPGWTQKM